MFCSTVVRARAAGRFCLVIQGSRLANHAFHPAVVAAGGKDLPNRTEISRSSKCDQDTFGNRKYSVFLYILLRQEEQTHAA